ncbi:MAG TPA: hypothetical protein VGN00_11740 [Puia sp.]|jgi:hypothetical protein
MRIIPYIRRQYETELSKETVLDRVKKIISSPDWNLTIGKAINNRILEGSITGSFFLVVMGKYALTYGKSSLLPIMRGEVSYDKAKSKTIIKIVIRPFKTGIIVLTPFYCIAGYGLVQGLLKGDFKLVFFFSLFLGITYGSLIMKYNREARNYIQIIETSLLNNPRM